MRSHEPKEIQTLAELESLFGEVGAPSLQKEMNFLHPVYQQWIVASPFLVLATCGPDGLDASPRGDPAGLVHIQDAHTLLLPERRGNSRIDSLRNILHHPQVGLLFFVPGVNETLRVNGKARILAGPELLERFTLQGKPPKCVLEVTVETAFFQCGRAVIRSGLRKQSKPAHVPTAGQMLQAVTKGSINGQQYDASLPQRQKDTLY